MIGIPVDLAVMPRDGEIVDLKAIIWQPPYGGDTLHERVFFQNSLFEL
jgi:hypothetical protein